MQALQLHQQVLLLQEQPKALTWSASINGDWGYVSREKKLYTEIRWQYHSQAWTMALNFENGSHSQV